MPYMGIKLRLLLLHIGETKGGHTQQEVVIHRHHSWDNSIIYGVTLEDQQLCRG